MRYQEIGPLGVIGFNTRGLEMQAYQIVNCPNCGSPAERHRYPEQNLTRTQCSLCDYLLITCDRSGRVVEAYAPGLYVHQLKNNGLSLTLPDRSLSDRDRPSLGSAQLATGRRRL